MGKGHLRGSRRSKQARLVERRYGYPGPRPQWNTLPFAMRRSILRRREREAQARRRAGHAGRAGRAGRAAAQHDAQLALATGNAAAASGATPSTGQDFSAAPGGDTANKNNGPCDGGGGGGDGGGDHVAACHLVPGKTGRCRGGTVHQRVPAYLPLLPLRVVIMRSGSEWAKARQKGRNLPINLHGSSHDTIL